MLPSQAIEAGPPAHLPDLRRSPKLASERCACACSSPLFLREAKMPSEWPLALLPLGALPPAPPVAPGPSGAGPAEPLPARRLLAASAAYRRAASAAAAWRLAPSAAAASAMARWKPE